MFFMHHLHILLFIILWMKKHITRLIIRTVWLQEHIKIRILQTAEQHFSRSCILTSYILCLTSWKWGSIHQILEIAHLLERYYDNCFNASSCNNFTLRQKVDNSVNLDLWKPFVWESSQPPGVERERLHTGTTDTLNADSANIPALCHPCRILHRESGMFK